MKGRQNPSCGGGPMCPLFPLMGKNERQVERLARLRHYPKGTMLFFEGDAVKEVFVVCAGLVRLFFHTPEGEEFICQSVQPGQVLGYTGPQCDKPFTLSAQVVEDGLVRVMSVADFQQLLRTEPDFHNRIAALIVEELHWMRLQLREFACKVPAEQRVARLLLRLTVGQGDHAVIHTTVEQLGQMVALKHRAMTRHLNELKRKGLIRGRGGKLVIVKRAVLEDIAE